MRNKSDRVLLFFLFHSNTARISKIQGENFFNANKIGDTYVVVHKCIPTRQKTGSGICQFTEGQRESPVQKPNNTQKFSNMQIKPPTSFFYQLLPTIQ